MKNLRSAIVLGLAVTLSGCEDKHATEEAQRLQILEQSRVATREEIRTVFTEPEVMRIVMEAEDVWERGEKVESIRLLTQALRLLEDLETRFPDKQNELVLLHRNVENKRGKKFWTLSYEDQGLALKAMEKEGVVASDTE